jgi:hypothetical protein
MAGMRLMIFDQTCRGSGLFPGLSQAWAAGGQLYRSLRALDHVYGASSWQEALTWLATCRPDQPIDEIQFWGHGKWGSARIDKDVLDDDALRPRHPLHQHLVSVRDRMQPTSRVWFRSCETFGCTAGHEFARRWTDFFGCSAAGHTYVIGLFQSGLHGLRPGELPHWSETEGLGLGTAEHPIRARWSRPGEPNTITCFRGEIPAACWKR